MGSFIDLTGQKFECLKVIELSYMKNNRSCWFCKCDCGKEIIVESNNLRNGHTKSCGCLQKQIASEINFENLISMKFSRLSVISFSHKNSRGSSFWLCRCECGKEKIICGNNLKNGHTKSCGCYNKERLKESNSGENNPNWKDGSSKLEYPSEWTDELRESIRNRDRRKCQFQDCEYDDTRGSRKLHIHHIDGNKNNCEQYNLISLCGKHHMEIERNNPSLWIDYFYQITGDYG